MSRNFKEQEKKKLENRLKKLKLMREKAKANNQKSALMINEGMIEEMEYVLKKWDS